MFYLGEYNQLKINRATASGFYLINEEGDEVLLPTKYILKEFAIGQDVEVFVYKDNEDRPIATTLHPDIVVNEFACLRVRETESFGAFLEWGLAKDLFAPLAEQSKRMEAGQWYVVFLFLDKKSDRLVASSKINRYLDNTIINLEQSEEVDLLIFEETQLGYNAIVNNAHKGLVYHNEIFKPIKIGDKLSGFVKKIREDNSLDISLQKIGIQNLAITRDAVEDYLQKNNGFIPLTDNSSPEEIMALLHMSKKAFKKSVGGLYRDKRIALKDDGIYFL
jgi:uncharacterized protein